MDTQYDIVTLATAASTQDEARSRLLDTGNATLVVAGEQREGRGRQGRHWSQPDRGMYASLAFASDWQVSDRTLIPLVTAVAMRRAISENVSAGVGLKWPNDIMIADSKVGGILVEASGDIVVAGCGLNLWWADAMEGASALLDEDPGSEAAATLAEAIAVSWAVLLVSLLNAGAVGWPRSEYESASVTLGEDVHWDTGTGRAVGIGVNGSLVVDTNGERIELHSGEAHTHRGG